MKDPVLVLLVGCDLTAAQLLLQVLLRLLHCMCLKCAQVCNTLFAIPNMLQTFTYTCMKILQADCATAHSNV